jgi:hypothetical protein
MSGNKKPRKAYKPKYAYLPSGIAGLPMGQDTNPSAQKLTDKAIERMVTADISPMDWMTEDFNRMVLLLNTAVGLSNRYPEYRSDSMKSAQDGLLYVLEYMRKVKSAEGRYGATMGLWQDLQKYSSAIISFFDTVPLVRMLRAEQSAFSHINSVGNYEYHLRK